MPRHAALPLCALVAVAGGLLAAPAPLPRPGRPSGPWFDGWDRPVDPVGDCRFDRKGGRLITLPGNGYFHKNAPRLLRNAEGDFVVQVRVRGDFQSATMHVHQFAGLLLTDGEDEVRLVWLSASKIMGELFDFGVVIEFDDENGSSGLGLLLDNPPLTKAVYLRLERRGDVLLAGISQDGKKWQSEGGDAWRSRLPQKLKVGVIAEATTSGTFKAVFDQFKLTQFGPDARSAARPGDARR